MSKDLENVENKAISDLTQNVYCVYDSQLRTYEEPFVCRESELKGILDLLVNNVSSKYWNNPAYYQLYCIGKYDSLNGEISVSDTKNFIALLGDFVDENRRKIQVCIQTLNYLPNGYFKMPDEMKKSIQEKIDSAIVDYCDEFIKNNPDVVNQHLMSKAGD